MSLIQTVENHFMAFKERQMGRTELVKHFDEYYDERGLGAGQGTCIKVWES